MSLNATSGPRWGTTSFIYPVGWAENVARLGPRVDDIELLVFSGGEDALPDAAEIAALDGLRAQHCLSYTVHTPLEVWLASPDERQRLASVAQIARVVEATRRLDPVGYVIHVYLGDAEHDPARPTDLERWQQDAASGLACLLEQTALAPRQILVESLDYDLEALRSIIETLDLSVAIDVGHLHRDGVAGQPRDLVACLAQWQERLGVIQWHGTDPEAHDHRALTHFPAESARELLRWIDASRWTGVVTIEVFSEADFEASWAQLAGWQAQGVAP